jgi:hypothetical protein
MMHCRSFVVCLASHVRRQSCVYLTHQAVEDQKCHIKQWDIKEQPIIGYQVLSASAGKELAASDRMD